MQSVGVLLRVPREFPSEQPSCVGVAPHHDSDFPFGTEVDYRDDKTWAGNCVYVTTWWEALEISV